MHTKAKLPIFSLLAALTVIGAGLYAVLDAGTTTASSKLLPAANPNSITQDLSTSQLTALRLGQPTALTSNLPGGAQYIFGSSVGALTELRGPAAAAQFSSLLNQPGAKLAAQWGPDAVYVFDQSGVNAFVLDTRPDDQLLLWLQGNEEPPTLSTLQTLYARANAGTLP